ncbi:MAG TPA: hypothetical protein VEW04_01055 [Allosphingosinicella sp.]|nr:hypothetical protein [Allosphingosinicella sp.]
MRRFLILMAAFWAASSLPASPARAEWRRAVSTHFIVYSEGSPQDVRAAAERLERFDGVLRRLSPSPPRETPVKLTVFMPRTRDRIGDMFGSENVAGFYRGDIEGPFVVAPRLTLSRTFTADVLLFHEYTHHFMLQNFSTPYPAWFVEGYAELLSNTRFEDDGTVTIGSFADHRSRELGLTPPAIRSLLFHTQREMRGTDIFSFYANAWLLTHYLVISDQRPGQLGRYIAGIAQGRPPEQAATEAFGDLDALQRDFLHYRRSLYIPTISIRFDQVPPVGPITLETLSPAEDAIVWLQARARKGVRPDDLPGFARDVRARAAAAPNDPATLQLLADTEYLAKDFPAATRAVDALLAIQPDAPRALLRRGLIEVQLLDDGHIEDAARWTAARDWIRRANRAAPDDPLILLEYYRAFERQQAGAPPSNANAGLARAYELAPQDLELRASYAQVLIRQRRYREAVTVLAPVAYAPHQNAGSEAAGRLIDMIRGLADGSERPREQAAAGAPPR